MSNKFEQYEHHGTIVWVGIEWKGTHQSQCLCYSCENMKPNQDNHCPIAQDVFAVDVKYGLVTPVFECPEFVEGEPDLSALEEQGE